MKLISYPVLLSLFCSVVLLSLTESCVYHELPETVCVSNSLTYTTDVLPIIQAKCAIPGCHNGGPPLGTDYNWTVYANFKIRADNGEVRRRINDRIMPPSDSPNGPLDQAQIDLITCWVDQGGIE